MIAQVIAGMERHLEKATEHHMKLRKRQERMQTNMVSLETEIQSALQTKLLLEMNLQVFRQTEWEANHPVRELGTQVRDFQLEAPASMTLPIVMMEPPAFPDPEPAPLPRMMAPPVVAPVARKVGGRGHGKMVAVVQGYTHSERAFIDSITA